MRCLSGVGFSIAVYLTLAGSTALNKRPWSMKHGTRHRAGTLSLRATWARPLWNLLARPGRVFV